MVVVVVVVVVVVFVVAVCCLTDQTLRHGTMIKSNSNSSSHGPNFCGMGSLGCLATSITG